MDCGCLSKDICICEVVVNENNLWCEICKQFEDEKNLIRKYLSRNDKNTDLPSHPVAGYLDSDIISLLKDAFLSVLQETEKQNCLDRRRSSYDPIDHFAQFLWAHNTRYPDRIDKYNNIHDMEWVQKYLRQNPRSFFPFHLVWNENFAAIKIQSYMRGYWVRKQENIQEVRKFWKQLKDENKSSGTSLSRRFYTIDEDYKSQFEK
ncbi:hypothetical protein WA026_018898 [Henosepilachna vigintioctopunctata]|uniref:Uncharacterized protein n=1 Tax=Henosepilachna vigintioctopunctata TaxID=420089 RepID=A0AAW1UPZ1_9CUCU